MIEPKAVAVALVLAAVPAAAQIPDKFTNLQVLPRDIAKPVQITNGNRTKITNR